MSLRNFLKKMEDEKEILHVKDEVSAHFQISSVMKSFDYEGPILQFDKVRGFTVEVVANVCGRRSRICKALGADGSQLCERLIEAWRSPKKPRIVQDGEVSEHMEKSPDLSKIPILTHFEKDAGPYVTAGVIHARSIDGEVGNLSVHRLQVLDRNHMAIRLVPRHLHKLWKMASEAGKDLDVAVSVGVHPAVLLAASSPLPFGVDEFYVANSLLGDSLRLLDCKRVNAYALADAELVLEGKISADKEVDEGPFGDIIGTYDTQRKQPVVEIVSVMHREGYVYEALLPSGVEHRLLMGLPREVLIWETVSKVVPKVNAVNLSIGGAGWLHAIISIEKQLDGDGKNALLAAFAAHPSLKHAVVVDSDIDVYDVAEVEWAIATRFQAGEDLVVVPNARGSTLDSSADVETGLTTKMGLDATVPSGKPKEKFEKVQIPADRHSEEIVRRLRSL